MVCGLAAGLFLVSGAQAQETPAPAETTRLDLYLLIGQSNMAGRGEVETIDKTPHPRVLVLDRKNQWKPAREPLHFDKPKDAGVGPGLAFGKAMAEANPEVTIGLIPCAVGGSSLNRWSKGGELYENALERTRAAMKSGTLKGILWHQGEAETKNKIGSENYAERLSAMLTDLRADLGAESVPVVAGQLGEFLYERAGNDLPYARTVNEQIALLANKLLRAGVVSSQGLKDKGDHLHFSAESARELGRRYAVEMMRLQTTTTETAR